MKVGFIGLGIMGAGMAHNLARSPHELVVHDLDRERGRPFEEAGATWADSVADLAGSVDVVLTSLPGPKQMREVGLGEHGLLSTMRSGGVWFDVTTNSPTLVREVHAACREHGVELFDAPVSGGPKGARSGKLAIYVGGDRAAFDSHRAVLDVIGDQVLYVGEIGAGNTAKLVHNCASISIRQAIAEVFTMGVKAGVEPAACGTRCARAPSVGRAPSTASATGTCSRLTTRRRSPSSWRTRTSGWHLSWLTSSTSRCGWPGSPSRTSRRHSTVAGDAGTRRYPCCSRTSVPA